MLCKVYIILKICMYINYQCSCHVEQIGVSFRCYYCNEIFYKLKNVASGCNIVQEVVHCSSDV